jgi:hypothetical protein
MQCAQLSRICTRCHNERAEPLCHSLNHSRLLCLTLRGQWRFPLQTDKMSAEMEIADRIYSLAQEQNDAALMLGSNRGLACTRLFLSDFEFALQYAMRGV